jgi:hypothetical protein
MPNDVITEGSRRHLVSWRDELVTELVAAQKSLPFLQAYYKEAGAQFSDASIAFEIAYQGIQTFHGPNEPPTVPCVQRHSQEVTELKSQDDKAHANLESAVRRIAECERTLKRIEKALGAPAEEQAA